MGCTCILTEGSGSLWRVPFCLSTSAAIALAIKVHHNLCVCCYVCVAMCVLLCVYVYECVVVQIKAIHYVHHNCFDIPYQLSSHLYQCTVSNKLIGAEKVLI